MYLRYGRAIKSLDENTLFPDAWEITVEVKDLTPNNFNTYIHHFIHGFESNVEIIRTKVKKDNWVSHTDASDAYKMRDELARLRQLRQGASQGQFVLFAAAAGDDEKLLLLDNARIAAGISDGWLLDQIEPTEAERRMQADADRLLEELNEKKTKKEQAERAKTESQQKIAELTAKLAAETDATKKQLIQPELDAAKADLKRNTTELNNLTQELDPKNTARYLS
jgi:hypothetical protein